MLSRIPARTPGELQATPETDPRRAEPVRGAEPGTGLSPDTPERRRVDSVQISRRGEDRRLESRPPDGAARSGPASERGGGAAVERPGLPRAPAPVNDLESRSMAIEAYRETAAARNDLALEPEPSVAERPTPERPTLERPATERTAPQRAEFEGETGSTDEGEGRRETMARSDVRRDAVEARALPPDRGRAEVDEAPLGEFERPERAARSERSGRPERGDRPDGVVVGEPRELVAEAEAERVDRRVEAPEVAAQRREGDERAGGGLPDPTYA